MPSLLQLFEAQQKGVDPLNAVRKKAWELFAEAPFESDVASLAKESSGSMLLNQLKGAVVLSLAEAQRTRTPFFQSQWSKLFEEKDPLSLLNLAVHDEGVWIYIPSGVMIENPIVVLPQGISRMHLYLGAKVSCSVHLRGEASQFYFDATLEKGSTLSVKSERAGCDTFRSTLKKGARLDVMSAVETDAAYSLDAKVLLAEEGATATFLARAKLHGARSEVRLKMHHSAPKTYSRQVYRTVLDGNARSNFMGEITIEKRAQKSEALQQSRALILQKGAIAKSAPILNIYADDVKASHGATVQQLRDSELFYLRSRGIALGEAKKLLVDAFYMEGL